MLKEYKEIYVKSAELLPNYKTIPQVELAEKYLEGGPYSDCYLSALVLRYWNMISKLIYKDKGLYDEAEAYDWFINSLLYAIKERPWQNPESTVYNDPKAVEKILNTCLKCNRANWFQASNRDKRKLNHGTNSLEALKEEFNDAFVSDNLIYEMNPLTCKDLILNFYKKQQYLLALIVDLIVNDIKLEGIDNEKSLVSSIKKSIKSLPKTYFHTFSKEHGLPLDEVEKSFSFIYNISDSKLTRSIQIYVRKLKNMLGKEL